MKTLTRLKGILSVIRNLNTEWADALNATESCIPLRDCMGNQILMCPMLLNASPQPEQRLHSLHSRR
jgi:hypothetical protein